MANELITFADGVTATADALLYLRVAAEEQGDYSMAVATAMSAGVNFLHDAYAQVLLGAGYREHEVILLQNQATRVMVERSATYRAR